MSGYIVTYGSTEREEVEEVEVVAESLGLTYHRLRDDDDNDIAYYDGSRWIRSSDSTEWTDIDIRCVS